MKIAFDGSAFWDTGMTYEEQYRTVKEAGYDYINPYNADFPGFFKRPKATDDEVKWHAKAIKDAGLEVAALTSGFRLNHPDEFMREYAIDCWKRMFDIGDMMGVKVFNTELGPGRDDPELREAKFMRSLDVLVPIMEQRGIRMDIQAHPDDFYEHNNDAYDIIRYYDSPSLAYLYSIPHTFHYDGGKGNIEHNLKYARKHLKHLLFADTYDYTKLFRYNVNPSYLYENGSVRAHAHIGKIGSGDIDFSRIFKTLREIGFNEQDDTIATFNPLGFPERAIEDGRYTKKMIEDNLVNQPSITEPMPEGYGIYAR